MDSVNLLQHIVSEYPRIWEFYKTDTSQNERRTKHAQRYPLPMDTLSMIVDFHKWTFRTATLFGEATGLEVPTFAKRAEVGACPAVISRLNWMQVSWQVLENKNKSLAKTLTNDIIIWQTRINRKVNDGEIFTYLEKEVCDTCNNNSVMRYNDYLICVNTACRNPITGEVKRWR